MIPVHWYRRKWGTTVAATMTNILSQPRSAHVRRDDTDDAAGSPILSPTRVVLQRLEGTGMPCSTRSGERGRLLNCALRQKLAYPKIEPTDAANTRSHLRTYESSRESDRK
jgi:hypothetical protein